MAPSTDILHTLNLGCGDRPMKGAVNHDRAEFTPDVDVWWDLEELVWPQQPRLFDKVYARDVLEHIAPNRFYQVMENIWHLTKVGGRCYIQVPQHNSENHLIDPTHWKGFHLRSFDYLDPGTRLGRNSWTTNYRWKLLEAEVVPRSNVNLRFVLEKIEC